MTEKQRRKRAGPPPGDITAAIRPVQVEVSALSARVAILGGMVRHRGLWDDHRTEADSILAEAVRLRTELIGVRREVPAAVGASSRFDDLLKSIDRLSGMAAGRGVETA